MKTIRGPAAIEETSAGIFPHTPFDIFSQILAVEFVDGLNHAFQQVTGGRILEWLVNGNEFDSSVAQQLLVNDGISPVTGKTIQLPNKNGFKRRMFGFGDGDHLTKGGTPVIAPAFSLVNEFPDNLKIMFAGIVTESPELGGDRKILVLGIRTDAGIKGCFHDFSPVLPILSKRFTILALYRAIFAMSRYHSF
jgi:hypothetical protein